MTQGKSTAPRISRLNQSCWFRSSASVMPITSLAAMAAPVKTKAFWKVCRNDSLCQRFTKLRTPIQWLGRPMKASDSEK